MKLVRFAYALLFALSLLSCTSATAQTGQEPASAAQSADAETRQGLEVQDVYLQEKASGNPRLRVATNHGSFLIELFADKAPKSVENFLDYADSGFYDGTVFHRVIPNFMVQGGGFTVDMVKKPTKAPIGNEADNGLSNTRGTLALARTGNPHSATAQFFVNVIDNHYLNHKSRTTQGWGYTVFGKVVDGMDVVDEIAGVPTTNRGAMQNIPKEPVVIETVTRVDG